LRKSQKKKEAIDWGACKKTLKKAMKKSGKELECLSILRRAKKVSIEKDTTNAKGIKKSSFMSLGVSRIKPLKIRLIIHQRKSWICIVTYVKRILIFEINKVICHFLYKDNERKRD